MNKLLVICGPTATGKTSLGIKLAKKLNGEIISADSRQVYRGMDIGTGKDFDKFSIFNFAKGESSCAYFQFSIKSKFKIGYYKIDGVPIWLLDIVEPDYQFNVADYVKCANLVIEDIWKRGKLPILVGGTGFYIKALIDGIGTMGIEPDLKLREKFRNLEIEKLREKLRALDPGRWAKMNGSDRSNPRRLIRAIEIAMKAQSSKLNPFDGLRVVFDPECSDRRDAEQGRSIKAQSYNLNLKTKNILMIGLKAPSKILYQRIDRRVGERVKGGIIDEIKQLLAQGYSWKNSVLGTTIGYKEWKSYFKTPHTTYYILHTKEVIQRWKYAEHAYARRQITWFQRDKRICWFDITKKGWQDKVDKLVEKAFHF